MTGQPVGAHCRACGRELEHVVLDLGNHPPANAYVEPSREAADEPRYPLRLVVCDHCWLLQLAESPPPEAIFTADYAYYSSYSTTWTEHASAFAASAIKDFALGRESLVIELGSNDGYMLTNFAARGIPVLGVEPSDGVATRAEARSIPTVREFFGEQCGRRLEAEGARADLVIANNLLGHVPDPHDLIAGVARILAPDGTLSLEFPHVLRTLARREFDTIYHEHYSYLSLRVVQRMLGDHDLDVVHVDELTTHGGSLRVTARPHRARARADATVAPITDAEDAAGLERLDTYFEFGPRVERVRRDLLEFLGSARDDGATVLGYGAPAKGNTLLNFCGITRADLPFTVDVSPHKQGLELPGSRVPIRAPEDLVAARPDYVLLLPWNLEDEIVGQLDVGSWGGKFIVPIPCLRVI